MERKLEASLNAYLDGALSPQAARALEARLARPEVARHLGRLRALRTGLAQARPPLDPAGSRRLWVGIRARVLAQPAVAAPTGWFERFLGRRWMPAWGLGLVGAGAALWLVLLRPVAPLPSPRTALLRVPAVAAAPAPVRRGAGVARPQVLSRVPVPSRPVRLARRPAAQGPSVVERALAANPVDDLIEQALQAPPPAMQGGSLAGFDQVSAAPSPGPAPAALGRAQGGPDAHGFWNWTAAADALNRRQWGQARVELAAAGARASSAGERAFANSALGLLAGPGGPLEGAVSPLASTGDLRIVGAGQWQLLVDARQANFVQGVSARMPGLRAEGNAAQMDLSFDRASFSPGTRFTRLSGGGGTTVLDAAGQPVTADQFNAPAGADYNVAEHVLRLR